MTKDRQQRVSFSFRVLGAAVALTALLLWPLTESAHPLALTTICNPQSVEALAAPAAAVSVSTTLDVVDGDTSSITNLMATPGGAGISLREAVIAANNTPGMDTINIPTGTYTLTIPGTNENAAMTGDLDLTDSVLIEGTGGIAIIQAGTSSPVAPSTCSDCIDRVFHITSSGVTAQFENLTIRHGAAGSSSGGGIFNAGTVTTTNCTISDNSAGSLGGGIINVGTATISNSTISNNSSPSSGGGISNQGTVVLTNSTISNNSATLSSSGGGIFNQGTVVLTNSTISNNTAGNGGGIVNASSTVNIRNSIVANNTSGGNCSGSVTASGTNFATDGTCAGFTQVTSMQLNLGPLQNNGGPTETRALLSGSVAINAGDQTICTTNSITTDQRGQMRISNCDVGAFEFRNCMTNGDCGMGNCCAGSECLVAGPGGCTPTAVEVASFTARAAQAGVEVMWQTADETDIAGFNVLRSTDQGQTYATLNTGLMAAQASGSPSGAWYRFQDGTARGFRRYWYILETIGLDGTHRRSEPLSMVVKRFDVMMVR